MGVAVGLRHEKFMACISSHEKTPRRIIRKAAKLATRYNTTFIALYVQTPKESMDRIDLASQRYLLNHFKLGGGTWGRGGAGAVEGYFGEHRQGL